jgi:predicted nucleotidyltransferase
MLEELNKLKPFFEDNYAEVHVRAYSRLMKISPPTASTILKKFVKDGLLLGRTDKRYDLYKAKREEEMFMRLQQVYWHNKLVSSGTLQKLQTMYFNHPIVLFGSIAKAEATADSDVDIAIIGSTAKYDFSEFEKKLKRKMQVITFKTVDNIPSNLKNSILNGYILIRGTFYGLE